MNQSLTVLAKSYNRVEADEKVIFLKIYKTYYQFLYRHGFYISHNKEITKECIQQMFFELWSKADRLSAVIHLKPYLKKYLERQIYKELTKSRKFTSSEFTSSQHVDESYESTLIKSQQTLELQQSLEKAIKCLTKRQIQLIELRFVKGYSFDEIGEMLGLQHRTIYNQIYTAIKVLRMKLKYANTFSLAILTSIVL